MWIYIYIHTCKYIYVYMNIHIYIHMHIYMYIHICIHTYIYMYLRTHTHTLIYTYICIYMSMCACIHIYIYTYRYIYIRAHTLLRAHTHTQPAGRQQEDEQRRQHSHHPRGCHAQAQGRWPCRTPSLQPPRRQPVQWCSWRARLRCVEKHVKRDMNMSKETYKRQTTEKETSTSAVMQLRREAKVNAECPKRPTYKWKRDIHKRPSVCVMGEWLGWCLCHTISVFQTWFGGHIPVASLRGQNLTYPKYVKRDQQINGKQTYKMHVLNCYHTSGVKCSGMKICQRRHRCMKTRHTNETQMHENKTHKGDTDAWKQDTQKRHRCMKTRHTKET